ncbi:hypothetical protein KCP76_16295 [Salmonella enterica subsp. enterica serovar Weltevreden]|nr:hypothetical protein KCP76_16295 [Salmonella enterica subsp. enterica serovar Weltevreden]
MAHDFTDPLTRSHNRVSSQEYTSLLYIPSPRRRGSVEPRSQTWSEAVRTARVHYGRAGSGSCRTSLRFVRGLIDSNDLPLNVSREILQDSTVTRNHRVAL